MGTGGSPYTNPLRPKVTIKTVDGLDTLYTYNAFDTSHDISIEQVDMENAVGETGSFGMLINDHNNEIGKDRLHNVKVFLELGKTQSSFKQFMIGHGKVFNIDRPGTNNQFYSITGNSTKSWLYKLYIHRREKYNKGESDSKIYNIATNAFTKRLWRPLKKLDESIEDITGISPDGISSRVNIPLRVVDKPFTYFGDLMDELCDISGAVWFVDYSQTGEEILTLTYKTQQQTSIRIKSGDLADRTNDDSTKTSYSIRSFNVTDDSSGDAGGATRLFSTTIQDSVEMWPLDAVNYAASSNSLNNQALGQEIVLDNDARRIESIELHLRKIGEPESPNSRVNGGIFMNKVVTKNSIPFDTPNMTYTLDEFHIDLGSIEEHGTKVQVDVDVSPKKLDTAQSKIWVVLFQRSGTTGDPTNDEDNTIVWANNNVFGTTQTVNGETVYSGKASGGDFNSKSKLTWNTVNTGPTYYVKVFSNIRRLFARTNGKAAQRQRLEEIFVPTEFLSDPGDVSRYLSVNLALTSKARRGIGEFQVTVPNNFLFRPYQLVSFHDGLSNIDDILQVQRARYSCVSSGDDSPLGTLYGNITLSGSYNTLVGACSCV